MPAKTTDQLRAIFGLGKPKGFGKEELEEMISEMTNGEVERLSLMSFDQANAMIRHLGGDPFPANGSVPRRTANHRKQAAGVPTIATAKHLKLMNDLAAKRNMTADGLERLCLRVIRKTKPATSKEANKIVEALKSMIARKQKEAA